MVKFAELTDEQRRAYDSIGASRDGQVLEVFMALMHSPELSRRSQYLGEYLRYLNCLAQNLSELAILVTARHWNCEYAWHYHVPDALEGGLAPDIIEALRVGRRPEFEDADEAAVYAYVDELQRNRKISDATYQRVLEALGDKAIVELTSLSGYYTMMAMTLNEHRVPLPEGAEKQLEG
jgi:4-carboxymuconolactone decarboxylase